VAVGLLAREVQAIRETLRSWARLARAAWSRRPPAPRATAIGLSGALALAGVLAVLAQARLPGRLPSARDWEALRALLEREARPGDAVALSPHWAERAREVLPASLPILAHARFAGEDLVGVRRVWLVSLVDAPGFSFAPEVDLVQRAARSDPPGRVGALEVTRYDVAFPVLPLAFLPDRLALAEVSRGGVRCDADGAGGFRCGGASARVAREVREVAGAPRPCLVAVPGDGEPLTFDFPPVRVGRLLRGHAGAVGSARLAAPLRVAVLVDGEEAGAAEVSGAAFAPFQMDTTRFAGRNRRVSLVVSTPGGGAEVCLDAVTLP